MKLNSGVFVGIVASLATSSGLAHHSFLSVFDPQKPFEVVGTVTRIELRNPHALLYMDVESEDGSVTNWSMELLSPNQLARGGWTGDALKPGDVVTVSGYAARDGSNLGGVEKVMLNDRKLFETEWVRGE